MSLRELMIIVAVAAVGMGGLKLASTELRTILQMLTGILLMAFLVKAVVDRGGRPAFAAGFILCALSYLGIAYFDSGRTPDSFSTRAFGTVRVMNSLYDVVKTETWINSQTGDRVSTFATSYPEANTVTRIELKRSATRGASEPTADRSAEDVNVISESPRGAGRRGSGGGGISSRLSGHTEKYNPEQEREYFVADEQRKEEIVEILRTKEGKQAVADGTPLSELKRVTYSRQEWPAFDHFKDVGYCLFALLCGYLGGHFARYVYARRNARGAGPE
ncbi:MAG: hypothetical protein WD669_06075 [Pirellulales bacterium]